MKILNKLHEKLKTLFPFFIFLWMTYIIYAPSVLFLNNIDEFRMHYFFLLPSLIIVSMVVFLILCLIGLFIPCKFKNLYGCGIFAVTLCLYLQMNFLNPPFRTLDGAKIDWGKFKFYDYMSSAIWIIVLIAVLILFFFFKKRAMKVYTYISFFLSAVQLLSLIILIFSVEARADNFGQFAFKQEQRFSIGEDKNIVVFVVDSLQVETMEKYLAISSQNKENFKDFTFFTDTVSGGAPTAEGMPILLTGFEYDPMQSRNEFFNEIWKQTKIYDDLKSQGYNIRLYTCDTTKGMPEDFIDGYQKIGDAVVSNHKGFILNLYKLVNFITLPQKIKQEFYLSTTDITDNIGNYMANGFDTNLYYDYDDIKFYEDMQNEGLDVSYDKAFRLYHLNGVHAPYNINENVEKVAEQDTTELQQTIGIFKIIDFYLEQLKQLDLYDKTTVIITGDHGQHESGSFMINPAILIKRADEHHDLSYNDAPICLRNVVSTIMMEASADYFKYGPTVYDITINSDVERLHTIPQNIIDNKDFIKDDCWKDNFWYRIIVNKEKNDYSITTWNPYLINRLNYQIGDDILFTENSKYEKNINYRVYKERECGFLSNEFTMCMEIPDVPDDDLILHFNVADVMNEEQQAQIYINGNFLSNITFSANSVDMDQMTSIPKECVDEVMVIRMLFPGAITPHMLDKENEDVRVLSVGLTKIWITQ